MGLLACTTGRNPGHNTVKHMIHTTQKNIIDVFRGRPRHLVYRYGFNADLILSPVTTKEINVADKSGIVAVRRRRPRDDDFVCVLKAILVVCASLLASILNVLSMPFPIE